MANGKSSKSKGKRRASRTPSADLLSGSSDEAVMEVPATQNSRSRKKPRLQSSPERSSDEATMEVPATQPSGSRLRKMPRRQSSSERVMGSVLSKATKRPKKGTGLAALVALVATRGREGSTAAKEETNKGLKNAAKRPKAKNRTRSAVIDDGIRVGKIAFLREGIKITDESDEDDSEGGDDLRPFYSTQSEVSVNANDLATLRQHGLCIISTEGFAFGPTDSHQDIDNKLRKLFPAIFQWFDDNPLLDYPTRSQWLICSKHCRHKKGVMVNSDDRKLPYGADIIAACQVGAGKVNFMDLTLFIVTRQKIPTKTIQSWNFPKEHDNSSGSDSDEVGENSAGFNSNLRILRSGPAGKLPKDIDTISISSDSSSDISNLACIGTSPMREGTITPRYPTPDSAILTDTFNSSLVFDRTIPNPWTTAS